MNEVTSLYKGWRCFCPNCGHLLVQFDCTNCETKVWNRFKSVSIIFVPLLAVFSWARWIYYKVLLSRAREDFLIAKETRNKLEKHLLEIKRREGNQNRSDNDEESLAMQRRAMRKDLLAEVRKIFKRVCRNMKEVENMKHQKEQLLEELAVAENYLLETINRYNKQQNYNDLQKDNTAKYGWPADTKLLRERYPEKAAGVVTLEDCEDWSVQE